RVQNCLILGRERRLLCLAPSLGLVVRWLAGKARHHEPRPLATPVGILLVIGAVRETNCQHGGPNNGHHKSPTSVRHGCLPRHCNCLFGDGPCVLCALLKDTSPALRGKGGNRATDWVGSKSNSIGSKSSSQPHSPAARRSTRPSRSDRRPRVAPAPPNR